jgi:hypothetical protein
MWFWAGRFVKLPGLECAYHYGNRLHMRKVRAHGKDSRPTRKFAAVAQLESAMSPYLGGQ